MIIVHAYTMIIVHACTVIIVHSCMYYDHSACMYMVIVHVSCPSRLSSLAMEVGGSGGRSALGKQGGFGRAAGPPKRDPGGKIWGGKIWGGGEILGGKIWRGLGNPNPILWHAPGGCKLGSRPTHVAKIASIFI